MVIDSKEMAGKSAAKEWAGNDYLLGLTKGSRLSAVQREKLTDSLAGFTGLSQSFIREHGLRIDPGDFARRILALQRKTVGMLDSRITGLSVPPAEPYDYRDPSMFVVAAPLTALINDYLRRELLYATSLEYTGLSVPVNRAWQWSEPLSQGYVDESAELRSAMSINTKLRVFAAMGYYDLTTPYLSQRYSYEHLAVGSTLIGRIRMKSYPSGHQIYTFIPALKQLTSDVGEFFAGK